MLSCFTHLDQCTDTCSAWSDWDDGSCSVTCGNGTKVSTRNRTCDLSICTTEETKFENCTELPCSGKQRCIHFKTKILYDIYYVLPIKIKFYLLQFLK